MCGGGLEVGFVSDCSWLALVTGVGGYVLAGVEIGVLSCIFLYILQSVKKLLILQTTTN